MATLLRLQRVERDHAIGMMELAMTTSKAGCAPSMFHLWTCYQHKETVEDD